MLEPTRNSRLQKCQEKEVTKADDTNKRIMEGVLENYSAPVSVTGNGPDKQAGGGKDQVSQVYTSTTRLLFMHYATVTSHDPHANCAHSSTYQQWLGISTGASFLSDAPPRRLVATSATKSRIPRSSPVLFPPRIREESVLRSESASKR